MDVVEFFEGANGVHVGVDAVAWRYVVCPELHSLPLGKRVHHLGAASVHTLDVKRHCMLNAVKVVVDAGAAEHKQRCCHAAQIKCRCQLLLECFFNFFDCHLGGFGQQFLLILFWYNQCHIVVNIIISLI